MYMVCHKNVDVFKAKNGGLFVKETEVALNAQVFHSETHQVYQKVPQRKSGSSIPANRTGLNTGGVDLSDYL